MSMSIPVLTQTYDEVRRLAIAGSVVAPGDFRLKKLVPQLEKAGERAPVFAKTGEAVTRLVESNEKTSAAALLELTSLVNAVLYTQGETGIDGEMVPIKTVALARAGTQTSARVLKPLLEALTTTGSGRLEVIRDAYERGAFHDLRLIAPALAALDDPYPDIGDLVAEKILPLYGQAIVPELEAAFDPKGRGGHVRRLVLMHRLDPETARPHVQRALEDGSKEVRIAAISCLGGSPEDLPFLLEQVKAKAKDVRAAALKALGSSDSAEAAKVLCDAIEGADLSLSVEAIRTNRTPALSRFLLEAAGSQFETLVGGKEKDKKKLGKQNERMCLLLECLRGRDDRPTEALLLKMFADVERIAAVPGEPSGKDVVETLVSVMAAGSPKVQSALVDAHETLPAESLGEAFIAACRSRKPVEVFALFSPYLTATVNEKRKQRDPAYAKREALVELLTQGRSWWWFHHRYAGQREEFDIISGLDPKWLDLAVKLRRTDLLQVLAVPGYTAANELLSELFRERLAKSGEDHELTALLGTMIRVNHPGATDATIELIKRSAKGKHAYSYYWLAHLVRQLPKEEALPKLEALLPTLPEKMVDQLVDAVTEMRS
jgi:hypothetical protein